MTIALRTVVLSACLALVGACGQGSAATGTTAALTEPQVRGFVEAIEASSYTDRERDVLDPALADDFKITFREPGEPDEVMDKDEYAQDADIDNVDYRFKVGDVRVAADGQGATAEVQVTVGFDADGTRYEESSRADYAIELRDGEPKVVAIVSDSTSLSIDGKKQY
jgi:hypothetical protein